MTNARKTYSMRDSIAPYKRPSVAQNRKKYKFLSKLKSYFVPTGTTTNRQNENTALSSSSTFRAPGGFYSAEDSIASNLSIGSEKPIDDSKNESMDEGNISNVKLADFFREKGEKPLSEVEYEGVLSLMKKSRSIVSTRHSEKILPMNEELNSISTVLRSSKSSSAGTPFKTPSFKPKYDDFSMTADTSLRSMASSTSSRRRVFDYSSLPSPYRTTVYKYSSASVPVKKSAKPEANKVAKPPAPKKLSNTATALISLLDGSSSGHTKHDESFSSSLANPYSSHVSQIKRYKKLHVEPKRPPRTPSKSEDVTPVKSAALTEIENTKSSARDPEPAAAQSFDKYKPSRSSSLRMAVSLKESPEKKQGNNQNTDTSLPVPQSSFSFSFGKQTEGPINPTTDASLNHGKPVSKVSDFELENKSKNKNATSFSFKHGKEADEIKLNEENVYRETAVSSKIFSEEKPGPKQLPNSKTSFQMKGFKTAQKENESVEFEFGSPPQSHIDPHSVDEKQVERYKSLYVF